MRLRVIADRLESFAEYTPAIFELRWPLVESSDIKDDSKDLVSPEVSPDAFIYLLTLLSHYVVQLGSSGNRSGRISAFIRPI